MHIIKNINEKDFPMIQIAVCDDQLVPMKRLMQKIRKICAVRVPERYDCRAANGFSSAEEVMRFLEEHRINILFLDIEMKGMNGFELAEQLNQKYPDVIIIFVSAYENYVYSAFQYAPFRFLRKTHLAEELEPALLAAIDKIMILNKTVEIDSVEGPVEIRVSDIIYFESDRNYIVAHMTGGEICRFRGTLTHLTEDMKNFDFCRIHQAYLINLANIKRTDGSAAVIMSNGEDLPISFRKSPGFKAAYMDYTNRRFVK